MTQKKEQHGIKDLFRRLAITSSNCMGSPWAFTLAFLVIIIWGMSGPIFHFSDTWQLVINTGTTIITFLMVFLIQNTQNRDMKAVHLKLDELICSTSEARNRLLDLEEAPDDKLDELKQEFRQVKESPEARPATGDSHQDRTSVARPNAPPAQQPT
jgi:low affinity Fe/Cu permease